MATGSFEIVIVGSGIAGLSAAVTAGRLGRSTLVVTGDVMGGHLLSINRIDGYPGYPEGVPGYDLLPMSQEQAADLGVEFASDGAVALEVAGERWRVATASDAYEAPAVIHAAGTSMKALGIPGEEKLFGKGVSHCASCDGPLLRDRETVVIGGGDSAMQEALTLAETVGHVIVLVKEDALGGQARYRDEVATNAKIEIRYGVRPEEILGADAVTGVRAGGETIAAAAVFPFIGLTPNSALLGELVGLAGSGHVPTDGAMRTAAKGLFAAGTVRAGAVGRAVAAAGDGAAAAIAADLYLTDGAWPANHVLEREVA